MHWISPKDSIENQKIRFRAMVAENKEAWYEGETLTEIMELDDAPSIDAHPIESKEVCKLCSEARYEVNRYIFYSGLKVSYIHVINYLCAFQPFAHDCVTNIKMLSVTLK